MQTWASYVLCRDFQNQTSFLRTPLQDASSLSCQRDQNHPPHLPCSFSPICNLYEENLITRFGICRKSNNCITYKHVSSNFLLLLFINVIKASLSQFLNISLPLCFKYKIGASKMMKILEYLEYHNLFYSDVSSFKYNRY